MNKLPLSTSPRKLLASTVVLIALTATPVLAQSPMQMPSIEQVAAELNLTAEQQPVFGDIMSAHQSRTMALLEKHGVDPSQGRPPLSKMLSMRGEMMENRRRLETELSAILTREQLNQLQSLQKQRAAR